MINDSFKLKHPLLPETNALPTSDNFSHKMHYLLL